MTRGGRRAGAGRKADADTPRSVRFELKLTPAQDWWLDHLATSAGLSRTAVVAATLDRTISEHTCSECSECNESVAETDPVTETAETSTHMMDLSKFPC